MRVDDGVEWARVIVPVVIFGGIVVRILVSEVKKTIFQNRLSRLGKRLEWESSSREVQGIVAGFPVLLRVGVASNEIELSISFLDAVDPDLRFPEGLVIRRENPKNIIPDIQLGDRAFDESVRIFSADASHVLAVLDEPTRVELAESVRMGFRVLNGIATCPIPAGVDEKAFIEKTVRLLARLSVPKEGLAKHLARRFETERRLATRLHLLWALIRDYAKSPESERTAELALRQDDPGVRFLGALFLGEKGNASFTDIWKGIADSSLRVLDPPLLKKYGKIKSVSPTLPIAVSLATSKNTPIPPKRLLLGFLAAIDSPHPPLVLLAVEGLKRVRRLSALALIERIGENTLNSSVLEEVVKALASRGSARQQTFLIDQLSHKNSAIVYHSTIALGKFGSVKAVPPLLELVKGSSERLIRRTAEKAIAQIQSRRGEGVRGDLSLSEEENDAGALSINQGTGELSEVFNDNLPHKKDFAEKDVSIE